jgi:glycosyltransferase involved in cell wall biosynthesis
MQPTSKFHAIPNGFDPDQLHSIADLVKKNIHSQSNGSIHLCHTGTLYGRRDLRPLATAVGRLAAAGRKITLEQIGDVGQRTQLVDFLRENRLGDCVTLQDQMPHDQILGRLARADLLVVIQPGTKIQVPAKLYEMIMFGKPLVALTEEGATADIIMKYNLGVAAPSTNIECIASAIMQAVGKQKDANFQLGWKAALDAFNGRNLTRDLANIFKSVTQEARVSATLPLAQMN